MEKHALAALAGVVGPRHVLAARRDLLAYSYDATAEERLPDAVVFPATAEDIAAIVRLARRERVPIVPRGAGTNLSGGTLPVHGGIILALSRMNRILAVDSANRRAVVEPGVVNLDLQNALAPLGFFYAPDPASQKVSTIGGNVAENSGGPHCFKYGVTTNHVLGLEVVLPDGEVIQVGSALEAVPGYDLTGLLVGSEGTLAIVTKIVVRIVPLPEQVQTMLAVFDALEDAGDAVSGIIAAGIVPATLELMDRPVVQAVEASVHAGYPLDAEAVLLIELDGPAAGLARQAQQIVALCRRHRAREVRVAASTQEREALWAGRRGAFGAIARLHARYAVQDGTVPRTRLTEALRGVAAIAQKHMVPIGNVAHAGDGNLHPVAMYDHRQPAETARVHEAGREILALCVSLGGTITGEHGIGIEKQDSMHLLFGREELAAMRRIKAVFDPANLLNPGKVIPPGGDAGLPAALPPASVSSIDLGDLAARLGAIVGEQAVFSAPALAVSPATIAELSAVLSLANDLGMLVIPRGAGTGPDAGAANPKDAMVVSLSRMRRLLEVDSGNQTTLVEAGLPLSDLDSSLRVHGLRLPIDPEDRHATTVGGAIAGDATGALRLGHGTVRDYVLGLDVVLPTGEIIRCGGKTVKDVAGYDLKKLFVGSQGTLGIVATASLRLRPLPECAVALVYRFADLTAAAGFVDAVMLSPLLPSALELLDQHAAQTFLRLVEAASSGPTDDWSSPAARRTKTGHCHSEPKRSGGEESVAPSSLHRLSCLATRSQNSLGEPLVLLGLEGMAEDVSHQTSVAAELSRRHGGTALSLPEDAAQQIWPARRSLLRAIEREAPGAAVLRASLPITRVSAALHGAQPVAARHQLPLASVAHAGSGVVYFILLARTSEVVSTQVRGAIADLAVVISDLGGLLAVEQGPGLNAEGYADPSERAELRLMCSLKVAFDPRNILNPGCLPWSRLSL